jgi:hypothetical protein
MTDRAWRPPRSRVLTLVGHLDADCFYVSAERVRSAYLRGKPVGVLGNQELEAVIVGHGHAATG